MRLARSPANTGGASCHNGGGDGEDQAKIQADEPWKQKHDRRDADLILKLLLEDPPTRTNKGKAAAQLLRLANPLFGTTHCWNRASN
jgi:hypothetical protein